MQKSPAVEKLTFFAVWPFQVVKALFKSTPGLFLPSALCACLGFFFIPLVQGQEQVPVFATVTLTVCVAWFVGGYSGWLIRTDRRTILLHVYVTLFLGCALVGFILSLAYYMLRMVSVS